MKYNEAYSKIIDAYFKNEIKPFDANFCFCGTLAPDAYWNKQENNAYPYTIEEYSEMEEALMKGLGSYIFDRSIPGSWIVLEVNEPSWEDLLFEGMSAALDVLKNIHKERGEDVDNNLVLDKRSVPDVDPAGHRWV